MKKLLSDIDSALDRKSKIEMIDQYISDSGLTADLIPVMAKSKYFPENAIKTLILEASDNKASAAIEVLEENDFIPDRGLLFALVSRAHHKAASTMIKSFNLNLTKPELMSIANKGGIDSIITALSLSPDLDPDLVESLIRSAVNDDLPKIYKLLEGLSKIGNGDCESIRLTIEILAKRAQFIVKDQLNLAVFKNDMTAIKEILYHLDEHNNNSSGEMRIVASAHYDCTTDKNITESACLLDLLKSKESSRTHFEFALDTISIASKTLTDEILENLIRFEYTHCIREFNLSSINKKLLGKIFNLKLQSYIKAHILTQTPFSNEEKIEIARSNGLVIDFINAIDSLVRSNKISKNIAEKITIKIITSASALDFSDLIERVKVNSSYAATIYENLGISERKEKLECLLGLEAEITKKIRLILSDADKILLADSGLKTSVVSKKRTWFPEAFGALLDDDLLEFRRFITDTYPLSRFKLDSCTKTNTERMQRGRNELPCKVWLNLTNEEFDIISSMKFTFDSDLSFEKEFELKRTWSDTDIEILPDKLKVVCVAYTKETEELLLYLADRPGIISDQGVYDLNSFEDFVYFANKINKYSSKIKNSKKIFNHAFDIIRPEASKLDYDTIVLIVSGRSRNEVLKILELNTENYSLDQYLCLECKEGRVFELSDSFPLDPQILKKLYECYTFADGLETLKTHGCVNIVKTIASAYVSKDYKTEMPRLGLIAPDRRRNVQEITELLDREMKPESSKELNLRGMKSVLRESKKEVVDAIIEKFSPEEVRQAIVKSWALTGNTLIIPYDDLSADCLVNLDNLLTYCGLFCLVSGVCPDGYRISREESPYLENMVGRKNIKFESLPFEINVKNHFYSNRQPSTPEMAKAFILTPQDLGSVIDTYKENFMSRFDDYNLAGMGYNLLNSMDPNEIIDSFMDGERATYLLGEKGMLTKKNFIQIQKKKIKFTEEIDRFVLAKYVARKIGCDSKEVPFLYDDNKKKGINCLNNEDSIVLTAKICIDDFDKGDRPITIRGLNSQRKLELINYAMTTWKIKCDIDPSQLNLENMDSIDFWTLESFKNIESKSLANLFGFREDDKKMISKIRDLLATKGTNIIRRVIMMRNLWDLVLGQSSKITIDDTYGSEENDPFCETYKDEIQELLNAFSSSDIAKKVVLSSKVSAGKLRDWLKSGDGYFKDTFEVIEKIIITNDSINDTNAKALGISNEDYDTIKSGSDNATNSLKTVIKNSDFSIIHDLVMKLVVTGDKEMLEVENQNKYEKLENKEVSSVLGYTLFFPKIYSDTYALGTQNGWCVSSSQVYSKKVREGEAILVGIAPNNKYASKDSLIESVEALLYVLFNKRGEAASYEIKFSNMMAKDYSGKLPPNSSRSETIGQQEVPPIDKYPVQAIIRMVQKIRAQLNKDEDRAA